MNDTWFLTVLTDEKTPIHINMDNVIWIQRMMDGNVSIGFVNGNVLHTASNYENLMDRLGIEFPEGE